MTKSNLGKAFESLIEAANQQYRITGLAAIEKQEIQTKFINGKMIYTKEGPPDFMGIVKGGTGIAFDAKSTRGKSWPLQYILRREHQLKFLMEFQRLGGHAFYLIEFADVGRVFMLPLDQAIYAIESMQMGGRKSIPITGFEIEIKSTWQNALDYLEPLGIKGA